MERFMEVWEKILAKFQEVFDSMFSIFDMIGGLTGGDEE